MPAFSFIVLSTPETSPLCIIEDIQYADRGNINCVCEKSEEKRMAEREAAILFYALK